MEQPFPHAEETSPLAMIVVAVAAAFVVIVLTGAAIELGLLGLIRFGATENEDGVTWTEISELPRIWAVGDGVSRVKCGGSEDTGGIIDFENRPTTYECAYRTSVKAMAFATFLDARFESEDWFMTGNALSPNRQWAREHYRAVLEWTCPDPLTNGSCPRISEAKEATLTVTYHDDWTAFDPRSPDP